MLSTRNGTDGRTDGPHEYATPYLSNIFLIVGIAIHGIYYKFCYLGGHSIYLPGRRLSLDLAAVLLLLISGSATSLLYYTNKTAAVALAVAI